MEYERSAHNPLSSLDAKQIADEYGETLNPYARGGVRPDKLESQLTFCRHEVSSAEVEVASRFRLFDEISTHHHTRIGDSGDGQNFGLLKLDSQIAWVGEDLLVNGPWQGTCIRSVSIPKPTIINEL